MAAADHYCIQCGGTHGPDDPCGRWRPDPHLAATVLAGAGSRKMSDFEMGDRCWLVANMVLAGYSGEDIRDRMSCSVRTVRSLAAHAMTQMCKLYILEGRAFAAEMELRDSELAGLRIAITQAGAERDRYRRQLGNVIDAGVLGQRVEFCKAGEHIMDRYNTYTNSKTGKRMCRACHRQRVANHRAKQRVLSADNTDSAPPAALTACGAPELGAGGTAPAPAAGT